MHEGKRRRRARALAIAGGIYACAWDARAADGPTAAPPDQPAEAVSQANTTLPTRTQFQFKPSYTFPNGPSGYRATLLFETILPYRALLIPGLEADGFWSIARVRLPARSLQDANGPASGLGDLDLTDIVAHEFGPISAALGFAAVFPMATNPDLGSGKLQLGPAAGLRLNAVPPWFQAAVLVQGLFSVAGSSQSPDLAYLTVQPFLTVLLPAAMFLSSNATMRFYGEGGQSRVPVSLGFGRAFGEHFVGALRGEYTVAGASRDTTNVEIGATRGAINAQIVLNFQP